MPLKLVGPRLAHGGHAARFREEGGEAGLAAVLGCFLPPRSARRGEPELGPRAQRHTADVGGGGTAAHARDEIATHTTWGRGGESERLAPSMLRSRRARHAQCAGGGGSGGGAGRGWRERANVFIRFSGWAVKAHASGRKAVGSRGKGGARACAVRAGSSGRAWRGLLEEKPGKREAEGKEGRRGRG